MPAASIGNIHIGLYVDVGDQRRFTDVANLVERDSKRMNTALGTTTRAVTSLRSSMNQNLRIKLATDSLRTLSRATDDITRMRAALTGLAAVAGGGLTGALSASYLIQTADKARLLSNSLKTVTDSTEDLNATQQALFEVSQRTRSSFESTVTLYARTARASEKLGLSQEKLLKVTETVQKAFAIGGASTQEASGAAIQLSQGIASDRFSGDEFRSIAENAPVLLRGIAEALNVDIAKLREMSTAGELTASKVTGAIIKASERIDKEFAKTSPTVGQAFTQLDNAFTQYIGQTDKAYGATRGLASALTGLAANFDEVMTWITRVGVGLTALYVTNRSVKAGQGFIGTVKSNNSEIRKAINELEEETKEIQQRRGEIAKEMVRAQEDAEKAATNVRFNQADKVHKAKEKEYDAQQGVSQLEQRRAEAATKLAATHADLTQKAREEYTISRQAVSDNHKRVVLAREAAIAEERNLRARLAQRVAGADEKVAGKANTSVAANVRLQNAAKAVEAETKLAQVRVAGEFAASKAAKEAEIDKRRQMLVTNAQRLKDTQAQIAELRSIQNLPGFEQSYGKQYKSLLGDQQKVMSSTSKVRSQITGLEADLGSLEQKAATSKGLTSAMAEHQRALKAAQTAVDQLAKAEEARNKIAAAPIGGRSLDARMADQKNALDTYSKSVTDVHAKLNALNKATAGAFDSKVATKMAASIDELDKKILAAQQHLKAASLNVATTQDGNSQMVAASMQAQGKAQSVLNGLEQEAAALLAKSEQNTVRLAAAQKRLNVLRRAGSGVVDAFGGWTGIAVTGAILAVGGAIGYMAGEQQKAEERTASLKAELNSLGLLSDEAAGRIDKATKSLQQLSSEEIRNRIKEIKAELEAMKGQTGFFASFFASDDLAKLGDIQNALNQIMRARGGNKSVAVELQKVIDLANEGKTPAETLSKRLDEISKMPASDATDKLIEALRKAIPYMTALVERAKELNTEVAKTPTALAQQFRASENKSMTDLQSMRDKNIPMLSDMDRDNNRTEYETKLKAETDKIIAAAEKLGNTIEISQARVQASENLAAEAAKKGLRDLIGFYEGTDKGRGYNETLDYGKYTGGNVNLTTMTLNEVLALQKKILADPTNDKNSSAVGRYQITAQTLRDFMGQLGLSGDTVFSQETQDRIADAIIRSTGGDVSKLRGRWTGLQKASDNQIGQASNQTFQTLPRMDESTQKWIDGLKDLNLQAKVAALKEFDQAVLQQAQSLGATNEELQQYIAAVTSGNLDKIPEKFKQIRDALRTEDVNKFAVQLKELQDQRLISFLSDVDQQVVQTAQSFGASADEIKAYVDAISDGRLQDVPASFLAIRSEMQNIADDKRLIEFTDSAADAFGDLAMNMFESSDAFGDFVKKLADTAIQMLLLQPIIDGLKSNFRGLASSFSAGGSSGGGGFLSGLFGSLFGGGSKSTGFGLGSGATAYTGSLPGYDDGGYTGAGGKKQPAGVVHKGEFVFDADSTRKIGPEKLEQFREYLRTGHWPTAVALPGYMRGGYVNDNKVSMPAYDKGGFTGQMSSGASRSVSKMGSPKADELNVNIIGATGNAEIQSMVQTGVSSALNQYNKTLPDRVNQIRREPRRR